MHIIALTGEPGAGKTCTAVYLAYREHKRGRKIVSNTPLSFPHDLLTLPNMKGRDAEVPWQDYPNALFLLDELHVWFDSRESMTKRNKLISYFVTQSRKRGVDVIYTTQWFRQVDVRIRALTTALIQCERKGDYMIGRKHSMPLGSTKPRRVALYMPPIYSLFDTNRIVIPE